MNYKFVVVVLVAIDTHIVASERKIDSGSIHDLQQSPQRCLN